MWPRRLAVQGRHRAIPGTAGMPVRARKQRTVPRAAGGPGSNRELQPAANAPLQRRDLTACDPFDTPSTSPRPTRRFSQGDLRNDGVSLAAGDPAGHGPTLFAGLSKHVDLRLVSRLALGSGALAYGTNPDGRPRRDGDAHPSANSQVDAASALRVRHRHPKRRHLLAVANQQHVADHHRMIPGLGIEHREPRHLGELVRRRRDERKLAFL
jgi:hypothetical protein